MQSGFRASCDDGAKQGVSKLSANAESARKPKIRPPRAYPQNKRDTVLSWSSGMCKYMAEEPVIWGYGPIRFQRGEYCKYRTGTGMNTESRNKLDVRLSSAHTGSLPWNLRFQSSKSDTKNVELPITVPIRCTREAPPRAYPAPRAANSPSPRAVQRYRSYTRQLRRAKLTARCWVVPQHPGAPCPYLLEMGRRVVLPHGSVD